MDTLEVVEPEARIVAPGIVLDEGELRPPHRAVEPARIVERLRVSEGSGSIHCGRAEKLSARDRVHRPVPALYSSIRPTRRNRMRKLTRRVFVGSAAAALRTAAAA